MMAQVIRLASRRARGRKTAAKEELAVPITGLIPGMAINFAGCCHPLPGDAIMGYLSAGRGVFGIGAIYTASGIGFDEHLEAQGQQFALVHARGGRRGARSGWGLAFGRSGKCG